MKAFIFAVTLVVSGAATAQTTGTTGTGGTGTSTSQTGTGGTGMGGTGMGGPANAGNYPPCSRTVTDSCIQTNERGMRRSRTRRR
jgi:hypothetical protein